MQDQDSIRLHDLCEIITFINPQAIQIILNDPKLFEFLKIIRIKAIDRQYDVQSRHSAYYAWMIYGWRPLHPDNPSYNSSHFLSKPELSQWIPRSFTRNKFISKDLYIVSKKISNVQEKIIFLQNTQSSTFKKKK